MAEKLIEWAGLWLILTGYGLLIAAASWVGWPVALKVAGIEALFSGGVLIALASARTREVNK